MEIHQVMSNESQPVVEGLEVIYIEPEVTSLSTWRALVPRLFGSEGPCDGARKGEDMDLHVFSELSLTRRAAMHVMCARCPRRAASSGQLVENIVPISWE